MDAMFIQNKGGASSVKLGKSRFEDGLESGVMMKLMLMSDLAFRGLGGLFYITVTYYISYHISLKTSCKASPKVFNSVPTFYIFHFLSFRQPVILSKSNGVKTTCSQPTTSTAKSESPAIDPTAEKGSCDSS